MAVNRDKILREAEKLVQKGRIDQAIHEYEKLLQSNPNDANTMNRVGELYGRIGEVEKAVVLYERIADFFTQDGFTTKAIAILKKINRLAPQRLDIFERLAGLYIEQGLVVEAKSQLQVLADWYTRNDQVERAIATHRKLVDLDPTNHMAHLKLADLLFQSKQASEAIAVYDRLGRMLLEHRKLDEAERLYRHALEQEPPTGVFLAPVCGALLEAGRTTVARELLDQALRRSPESRELQTLDVRTRLAMGDSSIAVTLAEKMLAGSPGDTEAQLLTGRALLAVGEANRARDLLLPVIERYMSQGDLATARVVLQDLLQAVPGDQRVLGLALRAFESTGERETIFALRAALAEAHFRSANHDAARSLYIELLREDPSNEMFRQRLASMSGAAVDAAELAPPLSPAPVPAPPVEPPAEAPAPRGSFDVQERLAEAAVFEKYGLVDKAIHHFEEILRQEPRHVEVRHKLMQLLTEQGSSARAVEVGRSLLEHFESVGDQAGALSLLARFPDLARVDAGSESAVDEDIVVILDEDEAMPLELGVGDGPSPNSSPERSSVAFEPDRAAAAEVAAVPSDLAIEFEEVPVQAWGHDRPAAVKAPVAGSAIDEEGGDGQGSGPDAVVELDLGGPPSASLDRLDLFISQELTEDAVRLLDELEGSYPGDPDLQERRVKLKARGVLLEDVGGEASEALFEGDDAFIDLAGLLEKEMAEEEAMVEEATGRGQEEALLEEVFREFQKGVAEQLSEEDSDTHFNLGIAYKEMGLLPEAIREFQISSRDPAYFVECCSMIGVCYIEQGMATEAASWYERALTAPDLRPESQLALRYELAGAFEAAGEVGRAVELFEGIVEAEPAYRDVGDRLIELSRQRQAN